MVGRVSTDVEGPNPGTRCRPDAILERVSVLHGCCDVREKFLSLVDARWPGGRPSSSARAGLDLCSDNRVNRGETTEPYLLTTNPWAVRPESAPMPAGCYERAIGTTHVWVDCLHWTTRRGEPSLFGSLLELLNGEPKKSVFPVEAVLEVSCLTWFYEEMGDYETSFVIEIHKPLRYSSELRAYLEPPFLHETREAARALAREIRQFLEATPPSPGSVQRRQAHEEAIRRAQQEHAEQEARARAERQAHEEALRRAAIEREERRERRREERRVAVIYDTSYLMTDRLLLHRLPVLHDCSVTSIISEEVKVEVERHLYADEEALRRRASQARGRINDLIQAQDAWTRCQDVRMSDVVSPREYAGPLTADSPTDRLLIEYGRYLLARGEYVAVVLASNDGGIRYVTLREQSRQPLFTISHPGDWSQVEPLQRFLAALDRPDASAAIEAVWADFDVVQDGKKGTLIHTTFAITGAIGQPCNVTVLFFFANGQILPDFNQAYGNSQGQVGVGYDFTPAYESTRCEDWRLFMPYEELHLAPGRTDLKYRIGIFAENFCLGWSNDQTFYVNTATLEEATMR